jgi:hypothetical protein
MIVLTKNLMNFVSMLVSVLGAKLYSLAVLNLFSAIEK